jgi:hypothetical protein
MSPERRRDWWTAGEIVWFQGEIVSVIKGSPASHISSSGALTLDINSS